jgi:hypothetical protein
VGSPAVSEIRMTLLVGVRTELKSLITFESVSRQLVAGFKVKEKHHD